MTKPHLNLLLTLSCLGLCACASVAKPDISGAVGRDPLMPEPSTRMQLADNQIFMPGELTNPEVMPDYPATLLPLQLPDQSVCVRFVVNTDGSVSDVGPVFAVAGCPADAEAVRPEFLDATVAAVTRWDFYSSLRCTFPPGTADIDKCNGPGSSAEQVALTLAYRFQFTMRGGKGSVQQDRVAR
ncbi:MAG: hypothetical protein ABI858_00900 [Pseudoxanthomonas sp.]